MLETLVSSRIRRALLEHILVHPTERFYLRGLAKNLNVTISPLRRELKRLEQSGMLHAEEEGNMLFYAVDTDSQAFRELARVTLTIPTSIPQMADATPAPAKAPSEASVKPSVWTSPLRTPVLLTASSVGMALVVVVAGILYLRLTHDRVVLHATKPEVTVVVPPPSSSGVMRGARWQVVPGGFGGFSAAKGKESF